MQLLRGNLTPLPISHTWATCQQPTVSATHGRLHSRRDDTKSAHCDFQRKHTRRWAAQSHWRSVTLFGASKPVFNRSARATSKAPRITMLLLCCTADVKHCSLKNINPQKYILVCWLFLTISHLALFIFVFLGGGQSRRGEGGASLSPV